MMKLSVYCLTRLTRKIFWLTRATRWPAGNYFKLTRTTR